MSNKDCFCPFDEDLAREIFKKKDKQTRQLKAKLEKIKEICQTYDKNGIYYNLTEDIMKVIEGVEDE